MKNHLRCYALICIFLGAEGLAGGLGAGCSADDSQTTLPSTGGSSGGDAALDSSLGGTAGSAGSAGSSGTAGTSGSAGKGGAGGQSGSGGASEAGADAGISLSLARATTLDSKALVLNGGLYGRYVNGISFEQQGLQTHDSYQYSVWYTATGPNLGIVALGRRPLASDSWTVAKLEDCPINSGQPSDNAHRNVSFGIARGDGTIHLSFGHHANLMNYKVSHLGITTNPPPGAQWDNTSLFHPAGHTLGQGDSQYFQKFTYPQFVSVGDDLLLLWRSGVSGNGVMMIARFDSKQHQWGPLKLLTKAEGDYSYSAPNGTYKSTTRNPYPNGIHYAAGLLHISWVWRECNTCGPDSGLALNNHDLDYFRSPDGLSWFASDGGALALPLGYDKQGENARVWDLDPNLGAINSQAQNIDSAGRVHVVLNQRAEAGSPYSYASTAGKYHHYYQADNGQWHVVNTTLNGGQRPKLLFDKQDNAYLLFMRGNALIVAVGRKAQDQWVDWQEVFKYPDVCNETVVDPDLLLEHNTISVQIQRCAKDTETSSELQVIDLTPP